jgi:O-antigen ligase
MLFKAVLISIFADTCKIQALVPMLSAIMFQKIMILIPFVGLLFSTELIKNIIKSFNTARGKALLFLIVWMVISVPFSVYPRQSFLFLTDHLWKMLITLCLILAFGYTKESLDKMIWAFFLAAGVFGVMAFISVRTDRFSVVTAYDPNENALLFVLAVPFIFWKMMTFSGLKKILMACLLALLVLGIVETQSRGGFLGLIAVALVCIYQYKRVTNINIFNFKIIAIIALFIGVMYFVGGEQYSNRISSIFNTESEYNYTAESGRLTIWRQGFELMLDNPFLGVGVDSFESALGRIFRMDEGQWQTAHNSFLQVGAELGFPGLIAFCFIIVSTMAYLKKATTALDKPKTDSGEDSSTDPKQKLNLVSITAYSLIGSWTGFIVSGAFLSVAYGNLIFFLIGTSWACINVASAPQERKEPDLQEKASTEVAPNLRPANLARSSLKRYGGYR